MSWPQLSCLLCTERRQSREIDSPPSAGPISHNIHGAASSLREQFIFRPFVNLGRIACSWWKERKRRCALLGARINVARFFEWQWSTLRVEDACTRCCYSPIRTWGAGWATSHFWHHVIGFPTLVSLCWFRTPSILKSDWSWSILFPLHGLQFHLIFWFILVKFMVFIHRKKYLNMHTHLHYKITKYH